MAETAEVVIIGGGVAGCATAYYLAKAGVKATIIERNGIASQASGFNAGGLNPLQGAGIPGPLAALAGESFKMHQVLAEQLPAESGIPFHSKWLLMSPS
jgi:glycine/D-amino acid oxidase-like deaminating enzyme